MSFPQSKLQAEGLDNEAMLDETIKKLDNDLKKARKKEAGETEEPTVCHRLISPYRVSELSIYNRKSPHFLSSTSQTQTYVRPIYSSHMIHTLTHQ